MRRLVLPFASALALTLSACGGGGSSSSSGGEDDLAMDDLGDESPEVQHHGGAIDRLGITPPPTPWAEMSREDREMYMVGKVMPVMNELFARQFPRRYGEAGFTCATCHGPDGEANGFRMPSAHLLPLPAYGSPQSAALASAMPESMAFMRDTVTPAMGTLLGVEGYRCSGCHTSAP